MKAFALNVLYIAAGQEKPTRRSAWDRYKAIDPVTFQVFENRIFKAEQEGYLRADLSKSSLRYYTKKLESQIARNVNEEIQDALLLHQLFLTRLSNALQSKIIKILNKKEAELGGYLRNRLADHKGMLHLTGARWVAIDKFVKKLRQDAWTQVREAWTEDIISLADRYPELMTAIFSSTIPFVMQFDLPDRRTLKALVSTNPFEGQVLRAWAAKVADADIQRILNQIRIGMINGEDSRQVAARVVGTAALKGTDGVTQISRNQAAAITRTAVLSLSAAMRKAFYDANADLFDKERVVATLDSRTTPFCRAQDGKVYARDEGPQFPAHFNCRTLRVPFLDGEVVGTRPASDFTENELVREFAELKGLKAKKRDDLPRGTRGEFNEFMRTRMREMTSVIPASTTYAQWLARQKPSVQDDILGVQRAKLWRSGKVTLEKFIDDRGRLLTLEQLASRTG